VAIHEAGEHLAAHAARDPDRPALVMVPDGVVHTYGELADRATRLARLLRARGLDSGDHVAVLVDNEPAFFDVAWAAMYAGSWLTPINWHLTAAEAGYVVADCDAVALVVSHRLADVVAAMAPRDLERVRVRLCVGGAVPGFEPLEPLLEAVGPGEVPDEHDGGWMFYSSGTTGRPKGILPPMSPAPLGAPSFLTRKLTGLFGFDDRTVYLSPAPLYHAAPAGWTVGTQRLGGTAVVMERFDARELLAAVERHRVTHVQLVPTHMIRLLELPEAERRAFDLSSLRWVIHAAAPCPVEVKQRFMDWVGPIVHEFYSGSEGAGFCYIGPEDWLAHPGSVGRSMSGAIHIVGEGGVELPVGEEGEVWFETSRPFEYHKDPAKTASVWDDRGWAWMGDVGRVDEDGYLYLTDRASHMIISGGVNIYPREAEDVLILHPDVADVGVLGVPDPEMGERVCAFVELATDAALRPDEEGAAALIEWCRARLSHFKCPREVRFVARLPRLPTGKLLKRLLVP
jgi:acyl-CoA synthetase (AMP-forming)/AMP-acid ligase II